MLSHYVAQGVDELDQSKLSPLLRLKYRDSIADAVNDLGDDIGEVFGGFQRHLYEDRRSAAAVEAHEAPA